MSKKDEWLSEPGLVLIDTSYRVYNRLLWQLMFIDNGVIYEKIQKTTNEPGRSEDERVP